MSNMMRTDWHALPIVIAIAAALFSSGARAQTVIEEWANAKAPPPPALKEVTVDPKKTALLIIDFNKKSCTVADRSRCADTLPKIQKFLTLARSKDMTVVHIYNIIMTPADLAIDPAPGERVMQASLNKFHGNDLERSLKDKGIDTVLITGTSANGAVLFTVAGAAMLGLKAIVPVDGMPADGIYQEQFVVWELANAPTVSGASTLTKWDMIKF
jgi:nicotinamidase-related amidase